MINRIRDIRREKKLTLADVGARCKPATTAQTIGRLETGTRQLDQPQLLLELSRDGDTERWNLSNMDNSEFTAEYEMDYFDGTYTFKAGYVKK